MTVLQEVAHRRVTSTRVTGQLATRWIVLTLTVIAVEVVYVFLVTAGTFSVWPTNNANYDLLAEGFRSGHLYIPTLPSPELLTKEDPFDPANQPLWFWDMSLYKGHYYLYWGPLPAALLALVKSALHYRSQIGDQYLVFVFYTLYIVSGTLLLERLARRLFPTVPLYLVVLAILTLTMANPNPYLISSAGISRQLS